MAQAPDVVEQSAPEVKPLSTYGTTIGGVIGAAPFTGWTFTLGTGPANTASASGTVYDNGWGQSDGQLAHLFRTPGGRRLRRLIRTLNGVAPGALAQENRTRLQHQIGAPGGLQIMEQIPYVNRATTAADVTGINALLDRVVYPSPYPVDVGGSGGGGKLAYKGI